MRVRLLRRSGLPRAFREHRVHAGVTYRRYITALVTRLRLEPITADVAVTVREAGVVAVELERLALDLERARARRRVRDAGRIRRQQFALREQLGRLEDRLAALAAERPRASLAEVMARRNGGTE